MLAVQGQSRRQEATGLGSRGLVCWAWCFKETQKNTPRKEEEEEEEETYHSVRSNVHGKTTLERICYSGFAGWADYPGFTGWASHHD